VAPESRHCPAGRSYGDGVSFPQNGNSCASSPRGCRSLLAEIKQARSIHYKRKLKLTSCYSFNLGSSHNVHDMHRRLHSAGTGASLRAPLDLGRLCNYGGATAAQGCEVHINRPTKVLV